MISLLLPKPGVTPVPPPELGLRQGKGLAFLYAMVRSPENFPMGWILAVLAAQGPDLYALLVGQDLAGANRTSKTLDMH